jgi:alpha-L-rhamnosidase
VVISHAEVLEDGELGTRPLREAKATTTIKLGGPTKGWEPKFTFYGFSTLHVARNDDCSVVGEMDVYPRDLGVPDGMSRFRPDVVSTHLKPHFESSHSHINQLHKNVVWGMLGNFVSVPTDCPQRDERLGCMGTYGTTSGTVPPWANVSAARSLNQPARNPLVSNR